MPTTPRCAADHWNTRSARPAATKLPDCRPGEGRSSTTNARHPEAARPGSVAHSTLGVAELLRRPVAATFRVRALLREPIATAPYAGPA